VVSSSSNQFKGDTIKPQDHSNLHVIDNTHNIIFYSIQQMLKPNYLNSYPLKSHKNKKVTHTKGSQLTEQEKDWKYLFQFKKSFPKTKNKNVLYDRS